MNIEERKPLKVGQWSTDDIDKEPGSLSVGVICYQKWILELYRFGWPDYGSQ